MTEARFSRQEDKVLGLSASGLSDKEIAKMLGISTETIRTYWQRMRVKTGASTRSEIVATKVEQDNFQRLAAKGQVISELEQEIERRKAAEKQLRASETLFRVMSDSSPLGVFLTDANGAAIYANKAYQDIIGLTAEELLGRGWTKCLFEEDRESVFKEWDEAIANRSSLVSDRRYRRPDGSVVYVKLRASCLLAEGEGFGFVGLVEDVTEQRSLQERNERLLEIINATPDYIISRKINGPIFAVNAAAASLLNLDSQDSVDQFDVSRIRPKWALDELRQEAVPSATERGYWQGRSALYSKDGKELPVSVVMVSHRNRAGELEYFSTISRDISDQVRTEQDLASRRDLIERVALAIPEIVSIFDLRSRRNVYANRSFTELLGYERDQIDSFGEGITAKLIHPDDVILVMEGQAQFSALLPDEELSMTYRVKRSDGTWVRLNARTKIFERDQSALPTQVITFARIVEELS